MNSFLKVVQSFFRGIIPWTKKAYYEWDKKDNLVQVQIITGLITIGTGFGLLAHILINSIMLLK